MSIESHYGDQNAIVQRFTTGRSTSGGTDETWATHLTVDALIRPVSAKERMLAGRIADKVELIMYTATADITNKDRVVVDSITYRIAGSPIDPNNRGHHLEIMLERDK